MGIRIIKKLSTMKLIGKPKFEEGQKKRLLYTLAGICRGYKIGTSQHGEYVAFRGDFVAMVPGETDGYRSPTAFFPEVFTGMLRNAVDTVQNGNADGLESAAKAAAEAKELRAKAKDVDDAKAKHLLDKAKEWESKSVFIERAVEVPFKVNIHAKVDERSGTGYVYEVETLLEMKLSDQMTALIAADNTPKLAETPAKQLPPAHAKK